MKVIIRSQESSSDEKQAAVARLDNYQNHLAIFVLEIGVLKQVGPEVSLEDLIYQEYLLERWL